MSKIVSFDFDGTLAVTKWPEIIRPIYPVVEYAKQCKAAGDQIILNTMREGERLQEAVDWCLAQGIEFDAVNDNVACMQEFYGNNPRKIFANEYIDKTCKSQRLFAVHYKNLRKTKSFFLTLFIKHAYNIVNLHH